MSEELDRNDTGVPETVLNWISAGCPEPAPAAVTLWRAEQVDAAARIAELTRLWRLTAPAEAPVGGLEDLRKRIKSKHHRVRSATKPRRLLQAAAGLLLFAAGAAVGSLLIDGSGSTALTRLDVPPGATTELALPGDISVRLRGGSSLSFVGSDDVREVRLEGDGFFIVPHDPSRDFVVRTASGLIRDLGTEFGVRARDSAVSVVVTEGVVALEAEGRFVEVNAGFAASTVQGEPPTAAVPASSEVALAWTQGRSVFIDQSLAQVARELALRFGTPVEVEPALRNRRVTASIDASADMDAALRLVTLAAGVRYERTDLGWLITTR